jgi:hypothetical protein
MNPFQQDPDWFDKYWYSQIPPKKPRGMGRFASRFAAFALAFLFR